MLLISTIWSIFKFGVLLFASLPITGTDTKFTDQAGGIIPRTFFCSSMPIYSLGSGHLEIKPKFRNDSIDLSSYLLVSHFAFQILIYDCSKPGIDISVDACWYRQNSDGFSYKTEWSISHLHLPCPSVTSPPTPSAFFHTIYTYHILYMHPVMTTDTAYGLKR